MRTFEVQARTMDTFEIMFFIVHADTQEEAMDKVKAAGDYPIDALDITNSTEY